uniref:Uncharacterized protein n=1 Tax=Caenorhabditis japonica TaxID=281687 RepID=A0A8R1ILX2_CAEJA
MVNYFNMFINDSSKPVEQIITKYCEIFVKNVKDEQKRVQEKFGSGNEGSSEKPIEMESPLDISLQRYMQIKETLGKILNIWRTIEVSCKPSTGKDPYLNPGAFEDELERLNKYYENFAAQFVEFRMSFSQPAENEEITAERNRIMGILLKIECILYGHDCQTITSELRNVIDSADAEKVKTFGLLAGKLYQVVDKLLN